jgi:hypothetical protein
MVTVLVLFCVMYMLSWWARNRIRTALLLTSGVSFVAAILLSDKGLVVIAVTLLLLPLLGKVRWGEPSEDHAIEYPEPIDIIPEPPATNPRFDGWPYW